MKAISIKQPWAYLICSGIKDIENRTWKCPQKYIGQRVLIHASNGKGFKINLTDGQMIAAFGSIAKQSINGKFDFGAIIGSVEIVDCVVNHSSIWAEKSIDCKDGCPDVENCPAGKCPHLIYNWILANPILFDEPILNVKGKLGFWDYEFEEETFECTNKNPYTYQAEGQRQGCIQHCDDCDYYKSKYE